MDLILPALFILVFMVAVSWGMVSADKRIDALERKVGSGDKVVRLGNGYFTEDEVNELRLAVHEWKARQNH